LEVFIEILKKQKEPNTFYKKHRNRLKAQKMPYVTPLLATGRKKINEKKNPYYVFRAKGV
jgi:hypothetical protein